MAAYTAHTLDIVSRDLKLISALSSAAENLAVRSTVEGISAAERAALRNRAKTANEQAGALLIRGTVELFSAPPDDAIEKVNDTLTKTQEILESIKKTKKAIEFVSLLVGVAGAILTGDWKAIMKSLDALTKEIDSNGNAPFLHGDQK